LTRVLIIEDERPMAEAIKYSLEAEGMEADFATDGEAGLRQFENNSYDVLILDLMLPGIDGLDICKEIRRSSSMPIIMLTARDSEVDKVIGLELGADDYLTKPFSMRELLARIRAVRRRAEMPVSEGRLIDGGDVAIDVDRHEVIVRGQVVDIPAAGAVPQEQRESASQGSPRDRRLAGGVLRAAEDSRCPYQAPAREAGRRPGEPLPDNYGQRGRLQV
jgi:two-component system response regulator RegX3